VPLEQLASSSQWRLEICRPRRFLGAMPDRDDQHDISLVTVEEAVRLDQELAKWSIGALADDAATLWKPPYALKRQVNIVDKTLCREWIAL
jgi:hypothetical protein